MARCQSKIRQGMMQKLRKQIAKGEPHDCKYLYGTLCEVADSQTGSVTCPLRKGCPDYEPREAGQNEVGA